MEKIRDGDSQKREDAGVRKGGEVKSRNTVFFQCFAAPEGLKGGSLKQCGDIWAGQMI